MSIQNTNQVAGKMELTNPETKKILRAHMDEEIKKQDAAVYSPMGKRFPSLKGILDEMKNGFDPVESMEEAKSQIQSLQIMGIAMGIIDLLGEDEDTRAIKTLLEKIDPIAKIFNEYYPAQERIYIDTARAIKEASIQSGLEIEAVVKNQDHMDNVSRAVHPLREDAESFLETSQSHARNMLHVGRGLMAFVKKTNQADEDTLKKASLIPTPKAMDAILKGSWDYNMKEYDRIYSA
ncbi:hypothetical protein HNV12_02560 [Methanococcoides sp. SA1]|nr:hypothetical protein [Methanococcoides sp. SA1]